jgi:ADP-ribosyl-[dinitrogen reductase] hydrolase
MRTSITHPLQIAVVSAGENFGNVGVTFCPGKVQPGALTGTWRRDLDHDLGTIAAWGAAAVVTLVDENELKSLQVEGLGEAVCDRHMAWYHLPIRDVSVPSPLFERDWDRAGSELRAILRDGFNVLVHCKGGLGRAGVVASRLLIELGMEPQAAIKAVREVRPGAIETVAQRRYVLKLQAIRDLQPQTTQAAVADRAVGAMLGLAIGDALGTTLEFAARDSKPRITDIVGGGPFRLKPGEWTDDTAMALALMDSLLAKPQLDESDLMIRFVRWQASGDYSCTGRCFDIGITTSQALARFKQTGEPIAGATDPRTAGNGSLMRLAPVAVRHWQNRQILVDVAARQSRTTHAATEAVDACKAYATLLADAIAGVSRNVVLQARNGVWPDAVGAVLQGSWRGKARNEVRSSGYVVHSLEAALWCVGRTGNFADAVILAANLGDDADTTAAITGQLAGALYGASAIPRKWLEQTAQAGDIEAKATALFAAGR